MEKFFIYPDYIFETIKYLDYPNIVEFCKVNSTVWSICYTNSRIRALIFQKYVNNYIRIKGSPQDAFIDAIETNNIPILTELLRRGLDPSYDNNYAIMIASGGIYEGGHSEVVKLLLTDPRVNPAIFDNLPLIRAVTKGDIETVRVLLADGRVNPAARDNLPLIIAIQNKYQDIAYLLLQDNRVNPAARGNLAIILASENGDLMLVNRLLEDERVDPSAWKNSALKSATKKGYFDVMDRLLEYRRVRSALD